MTIGNFWISFLSVLNAMSPYLLLGFLIAGILHVFVPKRFYAKYLSRDNKLSVLWAALLGIPLPLCSCGVIPTAVGLKNEGASKGAVASFLIATPQTGIDSILATFSLMGLRFAIVRPVAALVTGICGGLLVNRFVKTDEGEYVSEASCKVEVGNRLWRVLKYAYFDMIQDIGLRLVIGLLVAALINVAVPDEFFLSFGNQPLLQMLVILVVAVPMYICSTGSIPVAAALMMKGLSPGAALVMLMAGPAVNIASILVVKKSDGQPFHVDLSAHHRGLLHPFWTADQRFRHQCRRHVRELRNARCLLPRRGRRAQRVPNRMFVIISFIHHYCTGYEIL